ncbi:putative quinol monooxygenase [Salinispora tropica]|uniref:Antibiotic biosynthesis monooxygenase n=1 Tax=Salinispora tropica (strain ATCC BAA-916 / DSM 44818 / JCM 13857 / NBRC 105044 / CNB-440) TaxID=369723 RepID=A4XCL0_SALTO|nr:putative quinol monooxygenase [Salinispora tropica]ABP56667.1 Antibiotic biosynthesis monooxygenase [Salinispora tropica CNB-440]
MPFLTIVVHVRAKPDQVEPLKAELKRVVPIIRQDEGCVSYHLHQDNSDPTRFLVYENWESHELWQAHMDSPHVQAHTEATADKIEECTRYEMTRID